MKIFNFASGPAMMPKTVLNKVKDEFTDFNNYGVSIIEVSHRSYEFKKIIERAERNIRDIMKIGDNYAVCFIQGGASLQHAMIPMNLMKPDGFAEYADSGHWSGVVIKEAEKFGKVEVIGSSKNTNYDRVPNIRKWKPDNNSSYLHITTNDATHGTQYHTIPELGNGVPLIGDMSADIMTREIDVNQFGVIYAATSRVMGPTGLTIVIIRKDLVSRSEGKNLPLMLDYKTYVDEGSLHNTPPTFSIYLLKLVTDWIVEKGGMQEMEKINSLKSNVLYERIDSTDFYQTLVEPSHRSRVNVVFKTPSAELDRKFLDEAKNCGLIGLSGHRSVNKLRASMYNAMPLEGVEVLIDFMNDFEKKYG
ncbi:MAG: 3-phosphoserine/phosphohydroxythreonine transaminase [Victivallales bacterium]|nr:3-phosphoserine/phosphohydroxythreonine transaminase [Victivallales bacterium]